MIGKLEIIIDLDSNSLELKSPIKTIVDHLFEDMIAKKLGHKVPCEGKVELDIPYSVFIDFNNNETNVKIEYSAKCSNFSKFKEEIERLSKEIESMFKDTFIRVKWEVYGFLKDRAYSLITLPNDNYTLLIKR